jgi:chaperonin cofactor prefoldin
MGFFWHLIQQNQLDEAHDRTGSLERRVARLERELVETRRTLRALLEHLEQRFGDDDPKKG